MDGPSRRWKLRWWAKRSRPPKIRFKDTVPSRRERRELRRRLRKAGRDELAEQKEQVTRGLRRLAARRVLVASMQSGPTRGNELIEFVQVADGTHLMLEVRGDGTAALRRLAARSASDTAYLDHVETCFGHCWYRLRFCSAWSGGPEVRCKVVRLGSSVPPSPRSPRRCGARPVRTVERPRHRDGVSCRSMVGGPPLAVPAAHRLG
jgi:hypothetical protein